MFAVLKHVYIPLLFFSGVDYIDAPTPYMMGLHSGVDTSGLVMDGVSSFLDLFNLNTNDSIINAQFLPPILYPFPGP